MSYGTDMDSVVVKSGGGVKAPRVQDLVKLLEYPNKNGKAVWVTIRLFGPVYSLAELWVKANNKPDSNKAFPKICRCYDPTTHQVVADKYDPFYDELQREKDADIPKDKQLIRYQRYFYMQAIVRKLERQIPANNPLTAKEKKTGFKDIESDSFTPVVVVRLTDNLLRQIQDMKEDNIVTSKKTGKKTAYAVNHERFGRDIMIRFDENEKVVAQKYQVKLVVDGGRTPLTDEEKSYLKWDLEAIYPEEESEEAVKRDFESWAKRMGLGKKREIKDEVADNYDAFDEADEDEPPFDPPKKNKKSQPVDDDIDDSDDDEIEDDDDFEEKPKSKKKVAKKKVEDDDLDDDDSDFDDSEDDDSDDDSDDDFDNDDDDFDEDEPKSKKSSKSKKKVEDDDLDEDEDDFDEDDFDEREPEPKPKKKVAKKPVKKAKKKVEDDDDLDDDDSDW